MRSSARPSFGSGGLFTAGGSTNEAFKMLGITGAELHRTPAGRVQDWHTAPRRQFVVNLTGEVEIEVSDGETRRFGPGSILLAEDTTGKGHISRGIGNDERRTLFIPLSD